MQKSLKRRFQNKNNLLMALTNSKLNVDDPRAIALLEISERLDSNNILYINDTRLQMIDKDENTLLFDWLQNTQLRVICNGFSTRLEIDNPEFINNVMKFIEENKNVTVV